MRHWLKFELLELETIFEALNARSQIEKTYVARKDALKDELEILSKMERNEFSLSTVFLSDAQKERKIGLTRLKVPSWEADLINRRIHYEIVTLQMANYAIPFFKRGKFIQYYNSVKQFSEREIRNGEKLIEVF